jgi:hypothetical protein
MHAVLSYGRWSFLWPLVFLMAVARVPSHSSPLLQASLSMAKKNARRHGDEM